jgi:hypothetical protein
MGKFVNNSGNATGNHPLSYLHLQERPLLKTARTRVYYNLGRDQQLGQLTLNTTASGSSIFSTNVALNWPNGARALWVMTTRRRTDVANQIDNFSPT